MSDDDVKMHMSGQLCFNDFLPLTWEGFVGWPKDLMFLTPVQQAGAYATHVVPFEGVVSGPAKVADEVRQILDAFPHMDLSGELLFSVPGAGAVQKIIVTGERRVVIVHAVVHWPEELCPSVDRDQPHLKPRYNDRGFGLLPRLSGSNGADCSPRGNVQVYESSSAQGHYIWLRVQSPIDRNHWQHHDVPVTEAVVQLRADTAVRLAEQITFLVSEV